MRILVSLIATHYWPLHQLDVKNAFLNGVLDKKVYMKQPPDFVVQGRCAGLKSHCIDWSSYQELCLDDLPMLFGLLDFLVTQEDHSVFWRKLQGKRLLLLVYVNNIIIISDDMGCWSEMLLAEAFSDYRREIFTVLLRHWSSTFKRRITFFRESMCLIYSLRLVCWGEKLLMHP